MKKLFFLVASVLSAGSCSDFSMPASVTVKGSPGLYVPLGKISEIQDGAANITKFISKDEIKNMVRDPAEDHPTEIYDWEPPETEAASYVIGFHLADMTLDFSEYVKTDVAIPEIRIENPRDQPIDLPPVSVNLKDMSKLVKSLKGANSGVKIQNSNLELNIKIPALGIPDYIPGTPDGQFLSFLGGDFAFSPQTDNIEIFIRLTGQCPPTSIAPQLTLNWTQAAVDTSGDLPFAGKYPLDMSGLMNALGPGIAFKQAKGYVYITGVESGTISLTLNHTALLTDKALEPRPIPQFDQQGLLPPDSVKENDFIDLTGAFTAAKKDLGYKIAINEMTLTKEGSAGKKIAAVLAVVLPLEFSVTNEIVKAKENRYVKLNVGNGILSKTSGTDMFNREPNAENAVFDTIQDVTIKIKDIENTLFPSVLSVSVGSRREIIRLFPDNGIIPDQDIPLGAADYPFSPKFEILLPLKDGETVGTLTIQRGEPKYDFFLAAEAKAQIDLTF